MYDLIIVNKKLNIKKIIILIVLLVLLIIAITILGIKQVKKAYNIKYENQLEKQRTEAQQNVIAEQQAIQKHEQDEIDKTSKPLNQQQEDNILHIYKSTGKKRAFITFDDGPSKAVTPFILDTLKQYNIKASFFLIGTYVERYPDIVKREYDEGNYIGDHGYTHKYSKVYASPQATLDEYNKTEQAIRDAIGNQSYRCNVFRFPGGSNGGFYDSQKQIIKQYLLQNGIVHLDWNALSEDAAGRYTKEQLLANTEADIGNKDSVVILMHDSSDKILTYEMLPDLIKFLQDRGYTFESIYDLL